MANELYGKNISGGIRISSPFGEWDVKLSIQFGKEMFLETLKYLEVEYVDLDKTYRDAMNAFRKKREELGDTLK